MAERVKAPIHNREGEGSSPSNEFWRLLGTSKYCFYLCLLTYFGVYVPEKSTKSFGLLQLMTRRKKGSDFLGKSRAWPLWCKKAWAL